MIVEQEATPDVGIFVRQAKFARANIMPMPKQEFYDGLAPYVLGINERRMSLDQSLKALAKTLTERLQERARLEKAIAE